YPPKRQPIHHVPQLLKVLYDRDSLPTQALNKIILSIHERQDRAKKAVQVLNQKGFYCGNRLLFDLDLRQPPKITNFTSGAKAKNLDFGPDPQQPDRPLLYAEAWQGWKNRHLLNKPAEIRTQVLYPSDWEAPMRIYMKRLRERFGEFGIELRAAGRSRDYDPKNALSLRQVCQDLPPDSDLVFAFVPNGQDRDYDRQVNPYNTLKGQLNQAGYCSQMVTRQTMQQAGNDGRDQNVVFGILAKLGYAPWRLRSIPGTAQAFVGLDLGRKHDQTIGASAFVVDRQGQAIGWSSTALQRGETFSEASLRSALLDLFSEFDRQTGTPLRHAVVHRDGTIKNRELQALEALATELRPHGLEQLDVVEIVKDTIVRAAVRTIDPTTQAEHWINPPRGWGWEHGPNEAIVLTTGASQVKLNPKATPQPLLIRRRSGTTDLLTLAEQVYWLSEMHIGSTQVIRLPITTYYADQIATVALKGLLPIEVRCEHRLYFV
ncbi:MAG TPA: Piwi domain-containing protein, partial [Coleofasciculaceae cyanobacterium]